MALVAGIPQQLADEVETVGVQLATETSFEGPHRHSNTKWLVSITPSFVMIC